MYNCAKLDDDICEIKKSLQCKGENNNERPWLSWDWKWIFIIEMVRKIWAAMTEFNQETENLQPRLWSWWKLLLGVYEYLLYVTRQLVVQWAKWVWHKYIPRFFRKKDFKLYHQPGKVIAYCHPDDSIPLNSAMTMMLIWVNLVKLHPLWFNSSLFVLVSETSWYVMGLRAHGQKGNICCIGPYLNTYFTSDHLSKFYSIALYMCPLLWASCQLSEDLCTIYHDWFNGHEKMCKKILLHHWKQ